MTERTKYLFTVFVVVALLFAAAVLATKAKADSCLPIEQFRISMEHQQIHELSGHALELAAAIFRSVPPESDEQIATAVLVDRKDGAGLLVVGPAGELCAGLVFDAAHWRALRRMLLGIDT